MNKSFLLSGMLLSAVVSTTVSAETFTCPTLTPDDVREVIYEGRASTDGWTLIDESGKTADQIRADEPTAEPWDEYYSLHKVMYFDNVPYVVGIGSILGGDAAEARARAEKIILTSEENLEGRLYEDHNCMYKFVMASQDLASYPFKSHYETPVLMIWGRHHATDRIVK